jgi:hypothetical protein
VTDPDEPRLEELVTVLAYDPLRLATLARKTQASAAALASVTCEEPLAGDAATTSRGIAAELDEMLVLSLREVLTSTALTEWNGAPAMTSIEATLASGDELIATLDAQAALPAGPNVLAPGEFSLAAAITSGGDWFHDVNGAACVPFGGGSYSGGGYVTGPDGERYPIVIPRVETADGDVYTADLFEVAPGSPSVATLGGSDPGWEVVASATGIERFQAEPSGWERLAGFFAGTTGMVRPLPGNSELARVAMPQHGPPYLTGERSTPGPVVAPATDGSIDPADSSPGAVVQGGAALAVTAAQGVVMAGAMDNQTERAYQVVFEENGDGRRRARVQTCRLTSHADGGVVVVPEHVYVDADGNLVSQTISYGAPYDTTPPAVGSSMQDVAPYALSGDEPITYEVPEAVFP